MKTESDYTKTVSRKLKEKGNQSDGKITKSDKQKESTTKANQKRRERYYVSILISRVLSVLVIVSR